MWSSATLRTGTQSAQVLECVNACAMAVVPLKLYGIITNGPDCDEFRVRRFDEFALRPVALAQSTRAVAAQIRLLVFAYMAVIPCDLDDATRFAVIDLGWVCLRFHLEFGLTPKMVGRRRLELRTR